MQSSKELIKQYYDSFNHQDMDGFLNLLSDDVRHDINQGGSEIGKEVFAKFMKRMNHSYKETVKDLVIMTNEEGSRASAEFTIEGVYLATDKGLPEAKGQRYNLPCGAFFSINQDGKISRITNYYNLQDWLNQVKG